MTSNEDTKLSIEITNVGSCVDAFHDANIIAVGRLDTDLDEICQCLNQVKSVIHDKTAYIESLKQNLIKSDLSVFTKEHLQVKERVEQLEKLIREKDEDIVRLNSSFAEKVNQLEKTVEEKDSIIQRKEETIQQIQLDKESTISEFKTMMQQIDKERGEQIERLNKQVSKLTQQIDEHVVRANAVKIRQLEQLVDTSGEMSAIIKQLKEDTAKLVDRLGQHNISANDAHFDGSSILSGKPGHIRRIRELYKPLTEKLVAKSVAAVMYQQDALSLGELESIQLQRTPIEATESLLNIVLAQPEYSVYNCFMEALKQTNQEHIFMWITYNDFNIGSEHTERIRQNYTFLLEKLDVKDSGLVAELYSREVIDGSEKDELESVDSSTRRTERLLSMLSRKSVEQFERFMSALDVAGQPHIAKKIRGTNRDDATGTPGLATVADTQHEAVERPHVADGPPVSFDTDQDTPGKDTDVGRLGVTISPSVFIADEERLEVANDPPPPDVNVERMAVDEIRFSDTEEPPDPDVEHIGVAEYANTDDELSAGDSSETFWKDPLEVIKSDGPVCGVTSLRDRLYVTRYRHPDIAVYDSETFAAHEHIAVDGLTNVIAGLVSCEVNNCLYVSDPSNKTVHRVDLSAGNRTLKWRTDGEPSGLSVNSVSNVIVACMDIPAKILEYTTAGLLVRTISLHGSHVSNLRHAIQLTSGQFVVCTDSPHRVCLVDCDGRLVSYMYEDERVSTTTRQLNTPMHLAVDKNGGVFVHDAKNNRIVVLDSSSLMRSRDLPVSVDDGFQRPRALHYDKSRRRLYVGESAGMHVLIFDDV